VLDNPPARLASELLAFEQWKARMFVPALREARGIAVQSPVNLVLTDGSWLVATRFAFDYGWYPEDESFFAGEREHDFTSLWITSERDGGVRDASAAPDGRTSAVLVASEPLNKSHAGWFEVPEYSLIVAAPDPQRGIVVEVRELPW